MGKFDFRRSLGLKILAGLLAGFALGFFWPQGALAVSPLGEVFLRLLKMLMVPLVFFSIAAGVCKMGDVKRLSSVGLRFLVYVLSTSALCALLGVGTAVLFGLGKGVTDFAAPSAASAGARSFSFVDNAVSWVPENVVLAMAEANMMQVIVFAVFLGTALLALGERSRTLSKIVDEASETMLKITSFVMEFAPLGIGALVANMVVSVGGATAREFAGFVIADNLCCIAVLFVLYPLLVKLFSSTPVRRFARCALDPALVAFTTTSSAATLPVSIRTARDALGVREDIYGFILPLGNTCGMNGFAATVGIMSVFVSNIYGRPLAFGSVSEFVFLGIVLSVGAAGVKGAGIIMTGVLLETLGLPLDIVPLVAAVWPLIDPSMTVVNNVSDLAGTVIISDNTKAT